MLNTLLHHSRGAYLLAWVCICGTMVRGHTCGKEMESRQLQKKREDNEWVHIGHGGREILAIC